MRHLIGDGRKLSRSTSHRKALFRNLVTSLITHERIKTTTAKAKDLKIVADKMINLAKKGTRTSWIQASGYIRTQEATLKAFTVLHDRYKNIVGSYTRIAPAGRRTSDNAPMSYIEYINNSIPELLPNHDRRRAVFDLLRKGETWETPEEHATKVLAKVEEYRKARDQRFIARNKEVFNLHPHLSQTGYLKSKLNTTNTTTPPPPSQKNSK